MTLQSALSAIVPFVILLGLLLMLDAKRFDRHISAAMKLIKDGVSEPEAMQQSGCNHWDRPFLVRIWKKYPKLPS